MTDRELRLGVLFPRSGPLDNDVARDCIEAVEIGVDMFTPPGWRVSLVRGDPADPAKAAAEAERLVREERAQVLVGTLLSHLCLPASAAADKHGALYWEAIASADEVTRRGLRNVFRFGSDATAYASGGVDFVADTLVPAWRASPGQVPIATLAEDTAFPQSFARAAAARARARGFRVVAELSCPADMVDFSEPLRRLNASGAQVLVSAAFPEMVDAIWRQLSPDPGGLQAIVGISGWAFPRDPAHLKAGFERVFVVAAPYLYNANRDGLPRASRELLERWWARSKTAAGQNVAVDRDLTFGAVYVLLAHVLPRAAASDPAALRAAALALDLPMGSTPVGYGVKFDETGNNERSYALLLQWQGGNRLTVSPPHLATAAPLTAPLSRRA